MKTATPTRTALKFAALTQFFESRGEQSFWGGEGTMSNCSDVAVVHACVESLPKVSAQFDIVPRSLEHRFVLGHQNDGDDRVIVGRRREGRSPIDHP